MPNFAFLDNSGEVIAFAHRGGDAAGADKENTMAAFQAAHDMGYGYFETDVISSADGKVMAIHGSKNKKAVKETKLPLRSELQEMTYDQIQENVRIGGEPVPTLEEVLRTFPDTRVNIDPKTKQVVEPLAKLIRKTGAIDRVCIGAFSYKRTKAVAAELGGQEKVCTAVGPLGFLAAKGLMPRAYLLKTEAACLQLPFRKKDLKQMSNDPDFPNDPMLTDTHVVERARDAGLDLHVWTVNDTESMEKAAALGVDGIMSDNLVGLQSVLGSK